MARPMVRRRSSPGGASGETLRDLCGAVRGRRLDGGRESGCGPRSVSQIATAPMRYNEKELRALSRQPAEMAAELGMRGPKKGSVTKRRLVKLVANFLFYFRPDEAEPLGALLLERCTVAQEEPGAFAISFAEDPERKYHFECCSPEQCQEWMDALQQASYEYMRRSLAFYRTEIQKMTGKDPLEQFGISEETRFQLNGLPRDGRAAYVSSQTDAQD